MTSDTLPYDVAEQWDLTDPVIRNWLTKNFEAQDRMIKSGETQNLMGEALALAYLAGRWHIEDGEDGDNFLEALMYDRASQLGEVIVGAPVTPKPDGGNRVCEHCGQQFWGRAGARFCSSAHRQAAYRERQG
jgi:hypothetical protein